MTRLGLTAAAAAASTMIACAHPAIRPIAFPVGPGLLDGRPPQALGTYRVVGWVLSDHTGEPVGGASVVVEGTTIGTQSDDHGRYFLPDLPANRNTLLVRRIGYEVERRVLTRKSPNGLYACPAAGCTFSFSDTLNFWVHRSPARFGMVPACGLTNAAPAGRAVDGARLRRALLLDSPAGELGRYTATGLIVWTVCLFAFPEVGALHSRCR